MFKTITRSAELKPRSISFTDFTQVELSMDWCIYEIWVGEQLIHLGSCRLSMLHTLQDAKKSVNFHKIVGLTTKLNVVVKYTGNQNECYSQRGKMLRALPTIPPCNDYRAGLRNVNIVCNEDGKSYRTQLDVANAYGISQSAVSAHLNGRPGYTSIRGYTFRREGEHHAE